MSDDIHRMYHHPKTGSADLFWRQNHWQSYRVGLLAVG